MNILVTGAWQQAKENIHVLESMGHNVVFMQYEKDVVTCPYEWAHAVICNGLFLYHDISKFTNLRFIQLTSAGYDRVPMEYIKEKGITIYNAKDVYSIPMAEYAIAMTLYIYKQIEFFRNNQMNSIWEKHRNLIELNNKNVCVIGCGNVGIECAKRYKAFGCHVMGINDKPIQNQYFDKVLNISELKEILTEQDIVILSLPLTKETFHLFGKDLLDEMKDNSILINFCRGQIVDTLALIEVLNNKKMYAVLDVFEEEPLNEESPLWNMENVIITPHNSFVGEANNQRLNKYILINIRGI